MCAVSQRTTFLLAVVQSVFLGSVPALAVSTSQSAVHVAKTSKHSSDQQSNVEEFVVIHPDGKTEPVSQEPSGADVVTSTLQKSQRFARSQKAKQAVVANEDGSHHEGGTMKGSVAEVEVVKGQGSRGKRQDPVSDIGQQLDWLKTNGTWIYVFIASLSASVFVFLLIAFGDCLGSPMRCSYSDQDYLEAKLTLTREKARKLQEALKAQRRANQHDPDPEEGDDTDEDEAQDFEQSLTNQELVGAVLHSQRQAEQQAADAAESANKQVKELMHRADMAQSMFKSEVDSTRARSEQFVQNEASELVKKLGLAVGEDIVSNAVGMDVSLGLQTGEEHDDGLADLRELRSKVEPTPLSLLLAGAFAPSQLNSIKTKADASIGWDGCVAAVAIGIALLDEGGHCGDGSIWKWLVGVICINCLSLIASASIRSRADAGLVYMRSLQQSLKPVASSGNGVLDMFETMQNSVGIFFKSIAKYDEVAHSWALTVSKTLGLLSTLWLGYGTYIAIFDAVDNEKACDVKSLLFFLHANASHSSPLLQLLG